MFGNLKIRILKIASNFDIRISSLLFYLIVLFLPTQAGLHFWPNFSYIDGVRIDYLSPTLYLTDILMVFLFGALLLEKKLGFIRIRILLLILFLTIGIAWSKNQLAGLYGIAKFLELLFFGYCSARIVAYRWKNVISILNIGILFESVLAIFQFIRQESLGGILYFLGERAFTGQTPGIANVSMNGELMLRPYGTFSHPNVLAGYLTIAMVIVGSQLIVKSLKFERILYSVVLIIGSSALILTMSRISIAVWIFLLISFVIGTAMFENLKFKVFFLVVTGIIFGIVLLSPISYRFTSFSLFDESVVQRKELMGEAIRMVKEKPFFGVGIHNFLNNLHVNNSSYSLFSQFQPVHNIYLLVVSETGIFGFIFFIWFLIKTLRRIRQQESRVKKKYPLIPDSLFLILLMVMMFGFFDHYFLTLQQGQLLFVFLLGLCWKKVVK